MHLFKLLHVSTLSTIFVLKKLNNKCYYYYYYHHHHHIIIIIIISFMQGIYTYIPETSYVPRKYSVAAILLLLFMVLISLVSELSLFYFYISTFRSMCAVPNMAVFCSSLTSGFPCILILLLLLLLLLLTAVEFPLGGSSPYTSTDKTNKNKYT